MVVVQQEELQGGALPHLALLVAIVAVSCSSILIRWSDAAPLTIAFHRLFLTALVMTPYVLVRHQLAVRTLDRRTLGRLLGVGAILAVHFATWITSLQLTSVTASVVLVTAHPIFVGAVAHRFLDERLRPLAAVGIALAIIGIVVLAGGDPRGGSDVLLGDLLAAIGGIAAGGYVLAGRWMRADLPLVVYAWGVYLCSGLLLLVAAVAVRSPLGPLPAREYLLFGAMAAIPQTLGHTLYNWTLRRLSATSVSVSLLGEPIGASLLAWALLSEVPTALVGLGAILVLVGVAITVLNQEPKGKRQAPPKTQKPQARGATSP